MTDLGCFLASIHIINLRNSSWTPHSVTVVLIKHRCVLHHIKVLHPPLPLIGSCAALERVTQTTPLFLPKTYATLKSIISGCLVHCIEDHGFRK